MATNCLSSGVDRLHGMLRRQDSATRERKSLDGLWRFRIDPAGEGRELRWWRGPLRDAHEMPVPASYNDVLANAAAVASFRRPPQSVAASGEDDPVGREGDPCAYAMVPTGTASSPSSCTG